MGNLSFEQTVWNRGARHVRKRIFWHVHPSKTQISLRISLRIRAVWSESSLFAWRNFASLAIQNNQIKILNRLCATAQAGLNIRCEHMSEDMFSDILASVKVYD